MILKDKIDADIQKNLRSNGINYQVDTDNRIHIHETRMDKMAKAGMLYLIPKEKLPKGELPFLVVTARWVYGVFHYENKAAIIEVSTKAMDGKIINYYE